ncbi:MAG: hypothetical protein H6719_24080 [Sandaracinaceae bacterium]|nr:hypothetical protein [Sandaracinaceae bacterium]
MKTTLAGILSTSLILAALLAPSAARAEPHAPFVLVGAGGAGYLARSDGGPLLRVAMGEQWGSGDGWLHPLLMITGSYAFGLLADPLVGRLHGYGEVVCSYLALSIGAGLGYLAGPLWREGREAGPGGPAAHVLLRIQIPITGIDDNLEPIVYLDIDLRVLGVYDLAASEVEGVLTGELALSIPFDARR